MKKSKGDQFLCEDIIVFGILHRLPAKTLSRLKCVCKKWHKLISDNQWFIFLQSQNLNASSSILFMHMNQMDIVSRDPKSIGIPKFSPQFEHSCISLVASCNGLICIEVFYENTKLYVGNPVLNDWRLIQNHHLHCDPCITERYGLAVDYMGDSVVCFKLVFPYKAKGSYNNTTDTVECNFKIFSSDTGMRKVSKTQIIVPAYEAFEQAVCVRGTLYWMYQDTMVWFDPKEERGGLQPLPPIISRIEVFTVFGINISGVNCEIGEWNDMLSCIIEIDGEIQIWSMSRSCWSKCYSVRLEKIVEKNLDIFTSLSHRMSLRNRKPADITIRQYGIRLMPFQGDVLFFRIGREMFWYDMVTGEAGKHERTGLSLRYYWYPYKNCLVSSPSPEA